jgi:hypothetical protein
MWRDSPIFDPKEKGCGYELRFHDGLDNAFSGDRDEASPSTLVLTALVGKRFGELLAPQVPHGDSDLSLLGPLLLSTPRMPMALVFQKKLVLQENSESLREFADLTRGIEPALLDMTPCAKEGKQGLA